MTQFLLTGVVGYVFNVLHEWLIAIVSTLPDSTGFPQEVSVAWSQMLGYIYSFSFLFPLDQVVLILRATALFYIGYGVFKLVNYILNRIWGHG